MDRLIDEGNTIQDDTEELPDVMDTLIAALRAAQQLPGPVQPAVRAVQQKIADVQGRVRAFNLNIVRELRYALGEYEDTESEAEEGEGGKGPRKSMRLKQLKANLKVPKGKKRKQPGSAVLSKKPKKDDPKGGPPPSAGGSGIMA